MENLSLVDVLGIIGYDNHVIKSIERIKNSPFNDVVCVIVEGVDDISKYGPYFDKRKTFLNTSRLDNDSRNCLNVEKIVKQYELSEIDVIGIRDSDSTKFYKGRPTCSGKLFYTDARDIEMMILSSGSIADFFEYNYSGFKTKLNEALKASGYIGVYRIYNDINDLKFDFDSLSLKKIINEKTKSLMPNYKEYIKNEFERHIGCVFDYEFIHNKYYEISNSIYDYCQGHSVVSYLLSLKISSHNLTKVDFVKEFTNEYHRLLLFYDTELYKNLFTSETNKRKEFVKLKSI